MQKIDAVNWIAAARASAPSQCASAFISAMAQPRNRLGSDVSRQSQPVR